MLPLDAPVYVAGHLGLVGSAVLRRLEREGFTVVPTARAAQMTMNRDAIRDLAAHDLGLVTSHYHYAKNFDEVRAAAAHLNAAAIKSERVSGVASVDVQDRVTTNAKVPR